MRGSVPHLELHALAAGSGAAAPPEDEALAGVGRPPGVVSVGELERPGPLRARRSVEGGIVELPASPASDAGQRFGAPAGRHYAQVVVVCDPARALDALPRGKGLGRAPIAIGSRGVEVVSSGVERCRAVPKGVERCGCEPSTACPWHRLVGLLVHSRFPPAWSAPVCRPSVLRVRAPATRLASGATSFSLESAGA